MTCCVVVFEFISAAAMEDAVATEKIFTEFFHNVKGALRASNYDSPQNFLEPDNVLKLKLMDAKKEVHLALCDDLNTQGALEALVSLVKATNRYIADESHQCRFTLLQAVGDYITRMFKVRQQHCP